MNINHYEPGAETIRSSHDLFAVHNHTKACKSIFEEYFDNVLQELCLEAQGNIIV